jgi:hypothetical protein
LPEAIIRTGVWVGIEVDGALDWAIVRARFMSAALAGVHDAHDEFDRVDVVERQGGLFDVAFDLTSQGTADGREGDVHHGATSRYVDIADHAEFDDGGPEFGVEHLGEALSSRSALCTLKRYR